MPTNIILNGTASCLPQAMVTSANPVGGSSGGRIVRAFGEDARTSAGCPPIVTVFLSASPQNPAPINSNRSATDAIRGAESTLGTISSVTADKIAVATRPGRPAMEAYKAPGFSGATNSARPVVSVVTLSPFEN